MKRASSPCSPSPSSRSASSPSSAAEAGTTTTATATQTGRRAPAGPGRRDHRQLRLLAREGEAARPARQPVQRLEYRGRRQAGLRQRPERLLGRRADEDRQRPPEAHRLVAVELDVGPAAELRGRPALRARDEPVDRPHAARHRDVGADGQGARLPQAQDRLRRHPQARPLQPGLGRLRPPRVRPVQARPHQPGLLDLGPVGVVAEYYSATGKKEGLQTADIKQARAQVKDIERSIVHYGDTTLFISDELRKRGPGYASAVAMEEATLVDFNLRRGSRDKLVAIYPSEGTFYSDNPFITLDAPWVTPAQRAGAAAFADFLSTTLTPGPPPVTAFAPPTSRPSPRPRSPPPTASTPSSPPASSACPRRACSPPSRTPGAPTASRPTSCSCSTPPAR